MYLQTFPPLIAIGLRYVVVIDGRRLKSVTVQGKVGPKLHCSIITSSQGRRCSKVSLCAPHPVHISVLQGALKQ